jgi:hypothetical protein
VTLFDDVQACAEHLGPLDQLPVSQTHCVVEKVKLLSQAMFIWGVHKVQFNSVSLISIQHFVTSWS